MEHLLVPANPAPTAFRVPLVSRKDYDGGPFLRYADREGISWFPRCQVNEAQKPEVESVVQTWFFFGLLSRLLGPAYSRDNYIREVDGDAFITTETLNDAIIARQTAEVGSSKSREEKLEALKDLADCLDLINLTLRMLSITINWKVKFSIASICENLGRYLRTILGQHKSGSMYFLWSMDFPNEEVVGEMQENGWCISEARNLFNQFPTLQSRYFASRIDCRQLKRDHSLCSPSLCCFFQIDVATYEPKHVEVGCNCEHISLITDDHDFLLASIYAGKVPVLYIQEVQDYVSIAIRALDLKEESPNVSYTAISHVWADGLGNPKANQLPKCQLRRLARLTRNLHAGAPRHGIWMDTLCCPLDDPKARERTIHMMKDIYQNAKSVLVLDASLERIGILGISPFETLLRILISGWFTRLWTLQEGCLAKALLFRFRDGATTFDDLMDKLSKDERNRVRMVIAEMLDRYSWTLSEPGKFPVDEFASIPSICSELYNLDNRLQFRSVSVASDEPICISNLLLIPIPEVTAISSDEPEQRMKKMWELITRKNGGLPGNIAALPFKKLSIPGSSWLPASLLKGSAELDSDMASLRRRRIWQSSDLIKMDDSSKKFFLERPGHILEPVHETNKFSQKFWTTNGSSEQVYFKSEEGFWYGIRIAYHSHTSTGISQLGGKNLSEEVSNGGFAIVDIPALPNEDENSYRAMLGRVIEEGSHYRFQIVATAMILPIPNSMTATFSAVRAVSKEIELYVRQLQAQAGTDEGATLDIGEELNSQISKAVSKWLEDAEFAPDIAWMVPAGQSERTEWMAALVKGDLMYGIDGKRKDSNTRWHFS